MIKMVVCDMDGTLLQSDLEISARSLEVIKKLRDKGIIFSVATGRAGQLMKEYIPILNMNDYMILYNGAVIGHPDKDTTLFENIVPKEVVDSVIHYCEEHNIIYMVYTKEAIYTKPNFRAQFFVDRNKNLSEDRQCNFVFLDDMLAVKDHPKINKILIVEPDQEKYHVIKQRMITLPHSTVMASQSTFVDINPPGTSKGHALEILARYHNVDLQDVVAFGDQENDLEMIQCAGIGVAMGNARDDVKAIANDVTDTNNNDGFAQWVEKHILN